MAMSDAEAARYVPAPAFLSPLCRSLGRHSPDAAVLGAVAACRAATSCHTSRPALGNAQALQESGRALDP